MVFNKLDAYKQKVQPRKVNSLAPPSDKGKEMVSSSSVPEEILTGSSAEIVSRLRKNVEPGYSFFLI